MTAQTRYPVSSGQKRLWFFGHLEGEKTAYNITIKLFFGVRYEQTTLRRAFEKLIERHEPLRSVFVETELGLEQEVLFPFTLEVPFWDYTAMEESVCQKKIEEEANWDTDKPFDLSCDLPIRVQHYWLPNGKSLALATIHHIATDGWSYDNIMWRELHYFLQIADGVAMPPLPKIEFHYRDYCAWEQKQLENGGNAESLEYWKERLTDCIPLGFPLDKARPESSSHHGRSIAFDVNRETVNKLKLIGRQNGATLHMVLLSVTYLLLYRFTGKQDISIAIPVAGRVREEVEVLIGFFVNTVILRCDLKECVRFTDVLSEVVTRSLEAYDHQELPIEYLIDFVKAERNLNQDPFAQVSFQLNSVSANSAINTAEVENRARYDFDVFFTQLGGELKGRIIYNTNLFSEPTGQTLARSFQLLIESIADNPSLALLEYPLTHKEDENKLLAKSLGPITNYPREESIVSVFQKVCAERAETVALEVVDGDVLSYGELDQVSDEVAGSLRAEGIEEGMRVGVHLPRGAEMIISLLGILKAGAVYVPLDFDYPFERVRFMASDAELKIVVSNDKGHSRLEQAGIPSIRFQVLRNGDNPGLSILLPATEPAYIIYTSGTTGNPKGSIIGHRSVVRLVKNTNYVDICANDRFLQLASPSFDAATFEIWGALLNGACLVFMGSDFPTIDDIGSVIEDRGITTLWLTAGLFHAVVDSAIDSLSPLKQLLAGGDRLSPEHVTKCKKVHPHLRLINGYGPTENTTFSCCFEISDTGLFPNGVPIGRPIANSSAFILDDAMELVPAGVVGNLYLGGDGLSLGYWKREDLNRERFIEHKRLGRLYQSGDLARWNNRGEIEFFGRCDSQVKIRGYRVETGEIESVLQKTGKVSQVAVVPVNRGKGSVELAAYIVADEGSEFIRESLQLAVSECLPTYMHPSHWMFVPSLPLTPNGKLNIKALPDIGQDKEVSQSDRILPRTHLEWKVLEIWKRLLGKEEISCEDDFFQIGGHSLLTLQCISEIMRQTGYTVSVTDMFQAPTVRSICRRMEHDSSDLSPKTLVPLLPEGSGPPLYFLHGWGGDVFHFTQLTKRLKVGVPIWGVQAIEHAVADQKHESFEEMGAFYADEILRFHKVESCSLCGYSLGGMIAFETARHLLEKDVNVEKILLFDTIPMQLPFFPRMGVAMPLVLNRIPNYLKTIFKDRNRIGFLKKRVQIFSRLLCPGKSVLADFNEVDPELSDHYQLLGDRYFPSKCNVPIILFKSTSNMLGIEHGWNFLTDGNVRVRSLRMDHEMIIRAENLDEIAEMLCQELG